MTTELGAPLVPAEVDLRDFGFMPLDVLRLRDSDLAALATGDEFKAAVLLWCVAWHQVPAGSLPDDDRLLARYSGAGAAWKRVKDEALRGFVKCLDGRLYHQVIAPKALESWAKKQAQRDRTKAATEAREAKRRAAESTRGDQRDGQRNVGRDDQRDVARDVVQGRVKGEVRDRENPHTPGKRGHGVHGFPPGFDAFWTAYPRKTAKQEAGKAFARLKPDAQLLAAILAAVERQAKSPQWTKDGGQFIPHAATWINARRWEDSLDLGGRTDDPFEGAA